MSRLKPEYNDKEILEKVAEVEAEKHPYEYDVAGVEWVDIGEYFTLEDFGTPPTFILPNRLKQLAENDYLKQVYPGGASANATYRLTRHGWSIVDQEKPED